MISDSPPFDADNPWISLVDGDGEEPPYNFWVETWGGETDGSIKRDYFSKKFGDWMNQQGDPSHWRPIKK